MAFETVIEPAEDVVIICFKLLKIFCHFRTVPQTGKKSFHLKKIRNIDTFLKLAYDFLGKWWLY